MNEIKKYFEDLISADDVYNSPATIEGLIAVIKCLELDSVYFLEQHKRIHEFWKRLIEFQSKEKNPAMIKPIAEFFNKVIISYAIAL